MSLCYIADVFLCIYSVAVYTVCTVYMCMCTVFSGYTVLSVFVLLVLTGIITFSVDSVFNVLSAYNIVLSST